MANRFGRATKDTWQLMKVRQQAVKKKYGKYSGRVMFPSSHDIFDFPIIEEACFTVLRKLLEKGNQVLITTKPRLKIIKKIDSLFSEFKENIQFRFTITSKEDRLLRFWEPNAPGFMERFDCLIFTNEKDYKTSVSMEPFLDYNPVELVKLLAPFVTESIWVGKMNYIARNNLEKEDQPFYDNVRKNYETSHLWEIYNELKDNHLIRFKDSIRFQLGLEI